MIMSQKFGNQINSINQISPNTHTSNSNSDDKIDYNKRSCYKEDNRGCSDECLILRANNEEVAIHDNNKS